MVAKAISPEPKRSGDSSSGINAGNMGPNLGRKGTGGSAACPRYLCSP